MKAFNTTVTRSFVAIAVLAAFLFVHSTAAAATRTYLIDFGRSTMQTTATGWNNITSPAAGGDNPLVDSTGATSPVTLQVADSFVYDPSRPMDDSTNPNGTTSSTLYPATATGDSFFLGTFNIVDNTATLVAKGLDNTGTYDFRFYASRMAGDGADRTTQYAIGSTAVTLNATDNVNNYVDITNVAPTNGTITITITKTPAATFGYLGVLGITEHTGTGTTPTNNPPTANAGVDQAITLPTSSVTLTGTGTDTDGTIAGYAWSFVSGPVTPTIASATSATTSVTGLTTAGTYTFQLTVTDNLGATGTDTMLVTVNPAPQPSGNAPYGGTARTIPGTIQVEDFDTGGEGVAYHDSDTANQGGQYRPTEGVDIENKTGGGYDVGWTAAGEWMKYTVNVTTAGTYTVQMTVANPYTYNPTVNFELDGTTIITATLPQTASYQTWQTFTVGTVSLPQGQHVIRLYENTQGFNLDSFAFTLNGNAAPTANAGVDQTITLPTHTVTLSGSGNDVDGTIASYAWTEISSGGATITNPSAATTTVTDLGPGTYTFRLTVTDNLGATGTDDMIVTVNPEPVAACSAKKIVVLGSSTAAGYGLNPISDSWVNRYASYLTGLNTGNNVVNLAVSGYDTYYEMPTGSSTPNRPAPDPAHNITAALAQNPAGIIVNLPSNDVANGYTTAEIESNFQTIANTATAAGVPIWITTTQPRNLTTAQIAQQVQLRDWINTTYGSHALDFWSVVANPDGTINPIYGQGDGIHLNSLGHQKLYNRTAGAGIMVSLCNQAANVPPTANAGVDQTIMLPTTSATLTGTGTDTDGTIASYAWSFISGPVTPTIASPSTATTGVSGLTTVGAYTFRLTVTDNLGATGTDDMIVTVQPQNQPPTVGGSVGSVTLSGTATDPDGTVASYLWSQTAGAAATITTPSAATTTVTNLATGSYTFRLTVTDNLGATATKDVSFTLN